MERQERVFSNMEASDCVDTKQSKQRASIKWLLSKAFNNRVPENLQEPFYRDHEDQEHLKPPIAGGLANAELYCLALANMYSDPNYHSLNHWNILQTLARKGVHVPDPPDCALTETVLIQTNPLKISAHMSVIEALMVLYAREVVTLDRVAAAAQRFGVAQPLPAGSGAPHEDGLLCWINAACTALNNAEEEPSRHVPVVSGLQEVCDGTALAALVSFYCPEALRRSAVRVGRLASIQDCLHNLMLVHEFCTNALPHNVFHMLPEDVTYMRGSMRQNLIAMLADLFNMLEVHPVKSVKNPSSACPERNEHGVRRQRGVMPPAPPRAPHLRPDCDSPPRRAFTVGPGDRERDEFVVHRGRAVTTLATLARRDDDLEMRSSAAGRPSVRVEQREGSYAGRRSRRSSLADDSQLTVENFGGSQDALHFAGRNPEKELATVNNVRKISAPSGALDSYNPPVRSSQQDIRGSIQLFHGDFQNGDDNTKPERPKPERQSSQPPEPETPRWRNLAELGAGDGFYLNRDTTDGESRTFDKFRTNGEGQSQLSQEEQIDRRKTTTFSTPAPNTTTWQQQFMQQESQPNGDNMSEDAASSPNGGQAMAAQLNNIRLKLEEKRRRIEQEKRKMEVAVNRQRQQLGQQAFLQAVTRDTYLQYQLASLGKGARTPADDEPRHQLAQDMVVDPPNQTVDPVALEQYQQSIANLQDIQSDIARLATQQSQLQQQQQQHQAKQLFQHQSPFQQQYQQNIPQLHSQFSSQHNVSRPGLNAGFGSTPHIPRDYQHQQYYQQQYQQPQPQQPQQQQQQQPQQPQQLQQQPQQQQQPQYQYRDMEMDFSRQFYLHETPSPPAPARRTWAQHAQHQQQHQQQQHQQQQQQHQQQQQLQQQQYQQQQYNQQHQQEHTELRGWQLHQQNNQQYQSPAQEPAARTWRSPSPQLVQPPQPQPQPVPERTWTPQGFMLHERPAQPFQVHYNPDRYHNGIEQNHNTYTVINASPGRYGPPSPPPSPTPAPASAAPSPQRRSATPQRPLAPQAQPQPQPQPQPIDMEPQNISFIGNADDDALRQGIDRLNISSGTRTYRIPSPTRPSLGRNSFRQPEPEAPEKGFYISFDDEQPKRPKPPLRAKRGSPKKEDSPIRGRSPERDLADEWVPRGPAPAPPEYRAPPPPRPSPSEPAALVIGDEPDPNSAEEMERKKERIMLLSLQRRQRAEESRARAEAAAGARRARDEAAAELRARRRDDQARRREQILHQYKLKKAIEEAEREGKVIDKMELLESLKGAGNSPVGPGGGGATRLRQRGAAPRARPKTIHVDSGALQAAEGMLGSKQSSNTNLTAGGTMRRDYYRGSQDSLAERAGLYRDSPVEDRGGMSPGSASSGPLGRRGSCKTSRERIEEPQSARGRSKYSTYQNNFKTGRKSSSLMNLCDSGLGRATPPRRAASPGVRLGSPAGASGASGASGPGSLPGAIGKRRAHHDDASDVSSTHSSIMDYSGPRLYKQPATKSNRGIMLNAVEYCVFPGAVNAEAKRRVLEEVARSESKHFLVLFRDAGCQFRALYSYCPDTDSVDKLYGTGPKHVNDRMFDKFFKYNSGSKCFSQVHTKHLTVTIDAFTIHNSLWQGKKVQLPSKKDMALVI